MRFCLEHDFAQTYPYIYQMRFLDSQGFEMVRVEGVKGGIKTVSVSEL